MAPSEVSLFGIGMQEVAIILVVALIFIGPAKLPQVARTIGKGMRELRRASDDLKSAVMVEMDDEDETWRRPAAQQASKSAPYSDQSSSAAIAGSLVATGADDATETVPEAGAGEAAKVAADGPTDAASASESAEPANTVSRDAGLVASTPLVSADATASSGPDPMDADDHSGMPYAPNSPEMQKVIDDARVKLSAQADAKAAASDADSNVAS